MNLPVLLSRCTQHGVRATLLATFAALAGCAASPPAPPLLYLSSAAPGLAQAATTDPSGAPARPEWRLVKPIGLPAALDREGVMVTVAPGQWVSWQGLRWAEPLRDALPRVLAADLSAAHGARVWTGPSDTAAGPAPALRIDIHDWEAALPQAEVRLHAHWVLSAADGQAPARRGTATVRQPWPVATPQGLVQAQRAALQALAAQVARQAAALAP